MRCLITTTKISMNCKRSEKSAVVDQHTLQSQDCKAAAVQNLNGAARLHLHVTIAHAIMRLTYLHLRCKFASQQMWRCLAEVLCVAL